MMRTKKALLLGALTCVACSGEEADPGGSTTPILTAEPTAGPSATPGAPSGSDNPGSTPTMPAAVTPSGPNTNPIPPATPGPTPTDTATSPALGTLPTPGSGGTSPVAPSGTAGAAVGGGGNGPVAAGGQQNGGAPGMAGAPMSGGSGNGEAGTPGAGGDVGVVDTGAADNFSFFVTSYHHIVELSGSEDGFGGNLRYNGAATGLEGADAICQEMGRRVGFGHRTWRAYLSTSTVNAIDRIGSGPWYDFAGNLVAENTAGLTSGDRQAGGCCDEGTYDELGTFHDGKTDVNNDGIDDDDHDTMTGTSSDGTYAGFSCEDWTSTTAQPETDGQQPGGGMFGGFNSGIQMGHSWPAMSGQGWSEAHAGHACAAGTNFIQDGPGDAATVGGGGGYGGFYCFALPE